MPSLCASFSTALASRFDSLRSPWSTVTATSCGDFARPRQRAASTINAVEFGAAGDGEDQEGKWSRARNSRFASASETGDASSAADAFLLTVDALPDRDRRARIFAQHFRERRAGRLALAHRRQRLTEPQQRIRRARVVLKLGRNAQELLGGVAIALALEHALAEPVLRFRHEPVAREAAQEIAEAVLGQRVVLPRDVAVGHVVAVARAVGRRQRRHLRAGAAGSARRRCRHVVRRTALLTPALVRRRAGERREVERCTGRASAGRADFRRRRIAAAPGIADSIARRAPVARRRREPAEHTSHARCIRILRRIERIAATARGRRRRRLNLRLHLLLRWRGGRTARAGAGARPHPARAAAALRAAGCDAAIARSRR